MEKISGIYCIENIINNKKYIGKSKDIYKRFKSHLYHLKKNNKKQINRYLKNAFDKYGEQSFILYILEEINSLNENEFKEKEFYWINYYKTTEKEFGYNLRLDSSTKMFVHENTKKLFSEFYKGNNNPNYNKKWTIEQKEKMSLLKKEGYKNGIYIVSENQKQQLSERSKNLWKNSEKKDNMIQKLKISKQKYFFLQYDKNMNFINKWNSVEDIIKENPDFKWQNIYAVCNGYKKSYMGYIWKKENKI